MNGSRPSSPMLGAILGFAMAVGTFLPFAISALGPLIMQEQSLSRSQFGALITTLFGGAVVLSPVAGRFVDRRESRVVAIVLLVLSGAGWVAFSLGTGYVLLLGAAAFGALSQALANPITNRLVSAHGVVTHYGTLVGVKQSGVQLGTALASLLPLAAGARGWRPVLQLIALVPAAAVPWFLRTLPRDIPLARTRSLTERAPRPPIVMWMTVYAVLMGEAWRRWSPTCPFTRSRSCRCLPPGPASQPGCSESPEPWPGPDGALPATACRRSRARWGPPWFARHGGPPLSPVAAARSRWSP